MEDSRNLLDFQKINEVETQKLKSDPKFVQFVDWAQANGVQTFGIDLPVAFGSLGIPGAAAAEDLPNNKIIIAVPIKMIPSVNSAFRSPIGQMLRENPQCFNEKKNSDAEFNVLAVWVLYEKLKGEESFFAPYLNIINNSNTMMEWSQRDLAQLDCEILEDEHQYFIEQMNSTYKNLKKVIDLYPDLYPPQKVDESVFLWSYELVMTRCYGWSLPSTSLIPFSDMFNHRNESTTHYLTKLDFQTGAKPVHKQYRIKKNQMDFGLFEQDELKLESEQLEVLNQYTTQKIEKIQKHKKWLSEHYLQKKIDFEHLDQYQNSFLRELICDINANVLQNQQKSQIWELQFQTSTDTQDNDTSEDEQQFQQNQFLKLQKEQLRTIQSRKTKLTSTNNSTSISTQQSSQEQEKKQPQETQNVQDEAKIPSQKFLEDNISTQNLVQQNLEKSKLQKEQEEEDQVLEGQTAGQKQLSSEEEEVEVDNDQQEQEQGQPEQSQNEQESEESEWEWCNQEDEDVYFIIKTTQPHKQGEQLYNCYGRRTNRFLLMWYGFTFEDNQYDSYNFRLWMNLKEDVMHAENYSQILFQQYIFREDYQNGYILKNSKIPISDLTKQFRLKKTMISVDLILYLRIYLVTSYSKRENQQLFLTIPSSLDYELFVLEYYLGLLRYIRSNRFHTTIQQDQKILDDLKSNYQLRFAAIIRKSHQEIIEAQIKIVAMASTIVKLLQQGKSIQEAYYNNIENFESMSQLVEQRHKLYPYLQTLEQARELQLLEIKPY